MATPLLLAAQLCTGLVAGLLFGFAVAVMPGLRAADDHTFVVTMQRINVAIVNPLFLLVFLGAPALAVVVGVVDGSAWAWAGAGLAIVTLLITFAANIPLNNALDAAGPEAVSEARQHFEKAWVIWNNVRTVTGIGAFVGLLLV
jgi:uncharacterized membrane protein